MDRRKPLKVHYSGRSAVSTAITFANVLPLGDRLRMTIPLSPGRVASRVGERARTARLQRNLSIEAVAEALQIDFHSLMAAEAGTQDFSAEQIVLLSELLEKRPSWFFEGLIGDGVDHDRLPEQD